VIDPYIVAEETSRLAEQRRRNTVLIAEKKREAMAAVKLMQQAVERKIEAEKKVQGLVIVSALYGQLVAPNGRDDSSVEPPADVTIPLQCLVKDSQLRLHAASKASIVGFYDPCPDEPKQLRIRYEFRGTMHEVTIDDHDELKAPLRKHAL
jgi:DnaJ family protein C protein 11